MKVQKYLKDDDDCNYYASPAYNFRVIVVKFEKDKLSDDEDGRNDQKSVTICSLHGGFPP